MTAQYLYLRAARPVHVAGLGTGKTVVAKFCEQGEGDPTPIGGLTMTLTEDGATGNYAGVFSRIDLLAGLSDLAKKTVFLHIDDGAVWHGVFPWVPVDAYPPLLDPLRN